MSIDRIISWFQDFIATGPIAWLALLFGIVALVSSIIVIYGIYRSGDEARAAKKVERDAEVAATKLAKANENHETRVRPRSIVGAGAGLSTTGVPLKPTANADLDIKEPTSTPTLPSLPPIPVISPDIPTALPNANSQTVTPTVNIDNPIVDRDSPPIVPHPNPNVTIPQSDRDSLQKLLEDEAEGFGFSNLSNGPENPN